MRFLQLPLLAAATLSIFTITTAQTTNLPDLSDAISSQASAESSKEAAGTATPTTKDSSSKATGTAAKTTSTETSESQFVVTGSGSSAASISSVAVITGGVSGTNSLPKNLPTLAGAFVIVAPSVPPTSDAPFMQRSNLPEGTVFIVVGAVLGFLAMSVILWRTLVVWSMNRSVKRAAIQQTSHEKPLFRSPAATFYKYKDRESSITLTPIGKRSEKRGNVRPPTAPGAASSASLFFSPTAGAASGGMNQTGNRASNYLPAGYYAAGASQPGNGQGQTHIGGHHASMSMANLIPGDRYSKARSMGQSPPGSPEFRPHGASTSTVNSNNLNQAPGEQRAPSAYLDDLFDSENAPPAPGSHHYQGGQGRF
ncbi:hypothetical protein B0O99DRAFT_619095 [Bisporella sp. PMI_857]|nr:hypothetical protein B0O99DRAFT_619095 [Bisporella sp. PMI_857]